MKVVLKKAFDLLFGEFGQRLKDDIKKVKNIC